MRTPLSPDDAIIAELSELRPLDQFRVLQEACCEPDCALIKCLHRLFCAAWRARYGVPWTGSKEDHDALLYGPSELGNFCHSLGKWKLVIGGGSSGGGRGSRGRKGAGGGKRHRIVVAGDLRFQRSEDSNSPRSRRQCLWAGSRVRVDDKVLWLQSEEHAGLDYNEQTGKTTLTLRDPLCTTAEATPTLTSAAPSATWAGGDESMPPLPPALVEVRTRDKHLYDRQTRRGNISGKKAQQRLLMGKWDVSFLLWTLLHSAHDEGGGSCHGLLAGYGPTCDRLAHNLHRVRGLRNSLAHQNPETLASDTQMVLDLLSSADEIIADKWRADEGAASPMRSLAELFRAQLRQSIRQQPQQENEQRPHQQQDHQQQRQQEKEEQAVINDSPSSHRLESCPTFINKCTSWFAIVLALTCALGVSCVVFAWSPAAVSMPAVTTPSNIVTPYSPSPNGVFSERDAVLNDIEAHFGTVGSNCLWSFRHLRAATSAAAPGWIQSLLDLEQAVAAPPKVVALVGMGGAGKSVAASLYARRAAREGWYPGGVFTFCADNPSCFADTVRDTALLFWPENELPTWADLGSEEPRQYENGLSEAWRYLENRLRQLPSRWLLIIDSADDVDFLANSVVWKGISQRLVTSTGHVLVTTRNSRYWESAVPVDALSATAARRMLVRYALLRGSEDDVDSAIRNLSAAELGSADSIVGPNGVAGLPLAVAHAGSYIAAVRSTLPSYGFADYWHRFQEEQGQLLARPEGFSGASKQSWSAHFPLLEFLSLAGLNESTAQRYTHMLSSFGVSMMHSLLRLGSTYERERVLRSAGIDNSNHINLVLRLCEGPDYAHVKGALTTWRMSVRALRRKSPAALKLLHVLSISDTTARTWTVAYMQQLMSTIAAAAPAPSSQCAYSGGTCMNQTTTASWTLEDQAQLIGHLQSFSLVQVSESDTGTLPLLTLHNLVRRFTQQAMGLEEKIFAAERVCQAVNANSVGLWPRVLMSGVHMRRHNIHLIHEQFKAVAALLQQPWPVAHDGVDSAPILLCACRVAAKKWSPGLSFSMQSPKVPKPNSVVLRFCTEALPQLLLANSSKLSALDLAHGFETAAVLAWLGKNPSVLHYLDRSLQIHDCFSKIGNGSDSRDSSQLEHCGNLWWAAARAARFTANYSSAATYYSTAVRAWKSVITTGTHTDTLALFAELLGEFSDFSSYNLGNAVEGMRLAVDGLSHSSRAAQDQRARGERPLAVAIERAHATRIMWLVLQPPVRWKFSETLLKQAWLHLDTRGICDVALCAPWLLLHNTAAPLSQHQTQRCAAFLNERSPAHMPDIDWTRHLPNAFMRAKLEANVVLFSTQITAMPSFSRWRLQGMASASTNLTNLCSAQRDEQCVTSFTAISRRIQQFIALHDGTVLLRPVVSNASPDEIDPDGYHARGTTSAPFVDHRVMCRPPLDWKSSKLDYPGLPWMFRGDLGEYWRIS